MKMVERMARAMCAADMDTADGGAVDRSWPLYQEMTLAALRAGREPSEEMGIRGFQVFDQSGRACAVEWMCDGFTAMIDAAIREAEGK